MFKRFLRSNFIIGLASWLAALYLRFVRVTSKLVFDPPDVYEREMKNWPMILTLWHGHLFLGPIMAYPKGKKTNFLVSRHRDGEFVARIAKRFRLGVIRGSGSPDRQVVAKGGASSFRVMMRALEDGESIGITADVPKIGFKVGLGIPSLARASNRPVYPIAMVSSNRYVIETAWDRAMFPLPFGTIVFAVGGPIWVKSDADDGALEQARRDIESVLGKIAARACSLADKIGKKS